MSENNKHLITDLKIVSNKKPRKVRVMTKGKNQKIQNIVVPCCKTKIGVHKSCKTAQDESINDISKNATKFNNHAPHVTNHLLVFF